MRISIPTLAIAAAIATTALLPLSTPASAQMLGTSCGGSMGEGCMSPQGAYNQARRFHLPQWGVPARQAPQGYGYGGMRPSGPRGFVGGMRGERQEAYAYGRFTASAPPAYAPAAAAPALPSLPGGQHYETIGGRVIIVAN